MKIYYVNTERIPPSDLSMLAERVESHRAVRIERAKSILQRNEHIGADLLIKITALDEFGVLPSEIRSGYTEKGEPFVLGAEKFISISHSNGCAVLAVSDERVGIDIERIRLIDMTSFSGRYFTEGEKERLESSSDKLRAFFGIWTAKEAYFKFSNSEYASPLSVDTSKKKSPAVFECDGCVISAVGEESCDFFDITDKDVKALLALMS